LADRCVLACNGLDFLGRTLVVNEANAVYERRQALAVQKSMNFSTSSD